MCVCVWEGGLRPFRHGCSVAVTPRMNRTRTCLGPFVSMTQEGSCTGISSRPAVNITRKRNSRSIIFFCPAGAALYAPGRGRLIRSEPAARLLTVTVSTPKIAARLITAGKSQCHTRTLTSSATRSLWRRLAATRTRIVVTQWRPCH